MKIIRHISTSDRVLEMEWAMTKRGPFLAAFYFVCWYYPRARVIYEVLGRQSPSHIVHGLVVFFGTLGIVTNPIGIILVDDRISKNILTIFLNLQPTNVNYNDQKFQVGETENENVISTEYVSI
jgi:hypothetical protein